jgi:hypothetical protein
MALETEAELDPEDISRLARTVACNDCATRAHRQPRCKTEDSAPAVEARKPYVDD